MHVVIYGGYWLTEFGFNFYSSKTSLVELPIVMAHIKLHLLNTSSYSSELKGNAEDVDFY